MKDSEKKEDIDSSLKWDMYQERSFIENLFCQRFNFFILAYTIFVMAACTVENEISIRIILFSGIIILFLLWLTLGRAYVKLFVVLKKIRENEGVIPDIDKVVDSYPFIAKLVSVLPIMTYIVPFTCIISLVILLIFGWNGLS